MVFHFPCDSLDSFEIAMGSPDIYVLNKLILFPWNVKIILVI